MSALIPGLSDQLSARAELHADADAARSKRVRVGALAVAVALIVTGGAYGARTAASTSSTDCPLNRISASACSYPNT